MITLDEITFSAIWGMFLALSLAAFPPGQVEAAHGLPLGEELCPPSTGQPLGCVAGGFLPVATLPWPRSRAWAGWQPGNWPDLRTVGPHSFVPDLCISYQNFF